MIIGGEEIALKHITDCFEHPVSANLLLRELRFGRILNHENILNIRWLKKPSNMLNFDEVILGMDLMETDLKKIIKSGQVLAMDHARYFIYQLLRGLKYLHSRNVVHRDIKPRNLLVRKNCDLKICDFGLAKVLPSKNSPQNANLHLAHSAYVVTRWYRPPELLLAASEAPALSRSMYDEKVDLWSTGCVLAEILTRTELLPGDSAHHQLKLTVELLGPPSEQYIREIPNRRLQVYMRKLKACYERVRPRIKGLCESITDPNAADLLKRLLTWDPVDRYKCLHQICILGLLKTIPPTVHPDCPPSRRSNTPFLSSCNVMKMNQ
eukprot:Filipodium_phascolosomae@DN1414_c0_g1_i7.p1